MKKSIGLLLLLIVLSPAILASPAAAMPAVVFEPAEARFIIGIPFNEQRTTSVDVSLSDSATPIGAIRFGDGSTSQDIGTYMGYGQTGLFVSADLTEGGGKLTFSGEVPGFVTGGFIGYRFYPIRVNLYADADEESFIASADFTAEIAARYDMWFEDAPAIAAGESLDITINVTFEDNLTGADALTLPLKTLTLVDRAGPEPYKDLGLTITPDPAASTIRVTADAPVTGEETYTFRAESDAGTIEESLLDIRVTNHTLTFSTPQLLAEATETVDCYVSFDKRPASAPLSGFGVVMTISDGSYDANEDDAPDFKPLSSDTGSLSWNGLTIDLEADKSRLRVHGTAEEQWAGHLVLEGFLPDEDTPQLASDTLEIATFLLEAGNLFDFDNMTLTGPDGSEIGRMVLGAVNTLTFPLKGDPDNKEIPVTMRAPSGVVTRLSASDARLTALSAGSGTRAAGKNLVIRCTPREQGDYLFEALYAVNGTGYYEDALVGAGDLPSSGGCAAAAFAPLLIALIPLTLRRR